MWLRRAQEYEAKINRDIVDREVVRDLYRSNRSPSSPAANANRSGARPSREIAVVQHSTETEAVKEIESQLAKSPRRGAKAEAVEGEGDDLDADGDDAAVADEAA
jgi:CarD family transcriptional regulator